MDNHLVEVITNGIGIGKTVVIDNINNIRNKFTSVEKEVSKFENAISKSITQLQNINKEEFNLDEQFLEVHILILQDPVLKKEVIEKILNKKHNAANAFTCVIDKYIERMKGATNLYLQERYLDFVDIKHRVLKNMTNDCAKDVDCDVVLVVEELLPSMMMDYKDNLKAVIAKKGGYTSHAVIICKSREIPYVVINDYSISPDITVIVDTRKQMIFLKPSDYLIKEYQEIVGKKEIEVPIANYENKGVKLLANVSNNNDVVKANKYAVNGIGLYRTEFIFMNNNRPLTFDEQYEIYHNAILEMKDRPVCFRTFDVGDDKQLSYVQTFHKGIDNYKNNPELFETQVKALIMSNDYNNIKIMFPMIETFDEYIYLKNLVFRIQEQLKNDSKIEIGMMLETKLALDNLDKFKDVDFISLGTNDLTSELYHISRDEMSNYSRYINDLIFRLQSVVLFCKNNDICLSVCGELASVEEVTRMFLNIGIRNFSVSVSSVKSLEVVVKDYFEE